VLVIGGGDIADRKIMFCARRSNVQVVAAGGRRLVERRRFSGGPTNFEQLDDVFW
jgi:siroheme synthase (precorrin-2 oxidase/ferrochelatase)